MATFNFTQEELNTFINNSQCCFSSKVDTLINLKNIGDDSYDLFKAECMTLDVMLRAISTDISTEVCLTQSDFDYIFEQINKSCCNCR
jgi:hypothetical protein